MDASELFSAQGLVAVVTGGGTGIGLMIARTLEANGAERVYIVGRRQDVLDNAVKQAKFGKMTACVGDVTSKSDLEALARRIEKESGRVDVLVNNAGVMAEKHKGLVPLGSVEEVQKALWAEDSRNWNLQFDVNVTGAFFTTVALLNLLKKGNDHWQTLNPPPAGEPQARRTSQVISVTGIAAHHRAMSRWIGYAASKAALLHLMKLLSTILAPLDIRFNMLAPGLFPSEMTAGKGMLDAHNKNQLTEHIPRSSVPQGRVGDESDIAGAILYLCGRAGWYCNGVEVIVDGGRLSINPSTY